MDFRLLMERSGFGLLLAGAVLTNFAMWRMSKFAKVPWSARELGASDAVLRAYARKHGKPGLEKLMLSGYLLVGLGLVALAFSPH